MGSSIIRFYSEEWINGLQYEQLRQGTEKTTSVSVAEPFWLRLRLWASMFRMQRRGPREGSLHEAR